MMIGLTKCHRFASKSLRTMGNCFERSEAEIGSEAVLPLDQSASKDHAGMIKSSADRQTHRKPRILCLHGWRTNGDILSMQMAALQANTNMDCTFINAPFPSRGEPDKGIAIFYPDRPYYEWFYRVKKVESTSANGDATIDTGSTPATLYENLDESIKFLTDHLESNGPYDGVLGFSQGASMATRLVKLQERLLSSESAANLTANRIFKFVILIGGVPPQELVDDTSARESLIRIPSLHIMGEIDPLLPDSLLLEGLYERIPERVTLTHEEGHNIPSMRTHLYPEIQKFLDTQQK